MLSVACQATCPFKIHYKPGVIFLQLPWLERLRSGWKHELLTRKRSEWITWLLLPHSVSSGCDNHVQLFTWFVSVLITLLFIHNKHAHGYISRNCTHVKWLDGLSHSNFFHPHGAIGSIRYIDHLQQVQFRHSLKREKLRPGLSVECLNLLRFLIISFQISTGD